ncbi:MAG: minor capsid protein [Oscillospiraceae bacterium]|nr:minor capsid protein [Oscillospiraceae bacterium]
MRYQKNLIAYILKNEIPSATQTEAPTFSELYSDCAQAKMQYLFSQSGQQLYLALKEQPDTAKQLAVAQVENLFNACRKPYAAYCVCAVLTGATGDAFAKKKTASGSDLVKRFAELLADCVAWYERQKEAFLTRVLDAVSTADHLNNEQLQQMIRLFETGSGSLLDRGYRMKLHARLAGMENAGLQRYRYRSESGEKTCAACAALDGKEFAIADAEEGINFPLLHPNCRCWIEAPEAAELPLEGDVRLLTPDMWTQVLLLFGESAAVLLGGELGVAAAAAAETWKAIFAESVESYYAGFDTVTVNGREYRINRKTFTAVAADENGNLLVPENAKPYDEALLKLMRQRDALPKGDSQREEIEKQIWELAESRADEISINPDNPFQFYVVDTDVTEKLDSFMAQAEQTYAEMHKRSFFVNIEDFVALVNNGKPMDLKRQPGWEKPNYIYHGEIIQQDDIGNINYGYFGTFCNFPQLILLFGAGSRQGIDVFNREKRIPTEFWLTLFDDPRDTLRVLQGIQIYNSRH